MAVQIRITLGDVTDMEARVRAHLSPNLAGVELQGTVIGPYCESAKTLPAEFPFRLVSGGEPVYEAIITDPCMWSLELPHVYHLDIVARQDGQPVAKYHDKIGLRRLPPRRPVDFAPGTG